MIQIWDWGVILGIKMIRLEFWHREFFIRNGYWDWGLRLRIVIGDVDRRLRLGIGTGRYWGLRFGIGIRDWDWD